MESTRGKSGATHCMSRVQEYLWEKIHLALMHIVCYITCYEFFTTKMNFWFFCLFVCLLLLLLLLFTVVDFFWTAVTGHRCKALEDFPVAAAGSLAVSSGSCVDALELPLGLSCNESADELLSMFACWIF